MIHTKKKASRAAILYSLIGEHLPKEVLAELSQEELEKLLKKVSEMKKPTTKIGRAHV